MLPASLLETTEKWIASPKTRLILLTQNNLLFL